MPWKNQILQGISLNYEQCAVPQQHRECEIKLKVFTLAFSVLIHAEIQKLLSIAVHKTHYTLLLQLIGRAFISFDSEGHPMLN